MDKMKMQDVQLMPDSGDTMSTINDKSTIMGTTPATNGTSNKAQPVKGQTDHLDRACRSTNRKKSMALNKVTRCNTMMGKDSFLGSLIGLLVELWKRIAG